jgi:hypothetical protein
MRARVQLSLFKLANPRVVRFLLLSIALALMVLGHSGDVYASPTCGDSGCGGG